MFDNKMLLSTGEFAKLCGTTKDTLFHYEDIEILKPLKKSSNGYRYYSFEQIQQFYTIGVLRELGLSLRELKGYLSHGDTDKYIEMLKYQRGEIENKINKLLSVKKVLEHKVNIAKKYKVLSMDSVMLEEMESESLFVSKEQIFTDPIDITDKIRSLFKSCNEENIHTNYEIGFIKKIEVLNGAKVDNSFKIFVKVYNGSRDKGVIKTKAGKYLVAYHKEGFLNLNNTYNKILNYAKNNSLVLEGPIYESGIINDVLIKDQAEEFFKIYIKIKG